MVYARSHTTLHTGAYDTMYDTWADIIANERSFIADRIARIDERLAHVTDPNYIRILRAERITLVERMAHTS